MTFSLQIWLDALLEWRRHKADEPRVWREVWDKGRYYIREVTLPYQMDRLLVAEGMAESRTEAQRLLKSGAIEMRPWDLGEWWAKVTLKDELPVGVPVLIRRGQATYGLLTLMHPAQGQTLRFWNYFMTL